MPLKHLAQCLSCISHATSVLYSAYFPEAVNLMRQGLFCNLLTQHFWWETSLTSLCIMNVNTLLFCLADHQTESLGSILSKMKDKLFHLRKTPGRNWNLGYVYTKELH